MKRSVKRPTVTQPLDPSYKLIALTQGQNAIVDAEDYEFVNQWNWCAYWNRTSRCFYAKRLHSTGKTIYMQSAIIAAVLPNIVDHINHNGLDNRRQNLRACTRSQNNLNRRMRRDNTSGYRGVGWNKKGAKWAAYGARNGKSVHLGFFGDIIEAAKAYDAFAKNHSGEFAILNFPQANCGPSSGSGGAITS